MNAFSELRRICPPMASPGCDALRFLVENPLLVLENLELHVSYLTQAILAFEGLDDPAAGTQVARLNTLNNRGFLPTALLPLFQTLAGKNLGKNTPAATIRMKANLHLKLAGHLTTWFLKSYGPSLPPSAAASNSVGDLFQELRTQVSSDSVRRAARKSAMRRASTSEQVRIMLRDTPESQVRADAPEMDPQGMGINGLLRSELYGLESALDLPTLMKIHDRDEIRAKQKRLQKKGKDLSPEDRMKLICLSDELATLGFTRDFRDPIEQQFADAMARQRHSKHGELLLTFNELKKREKLADSMLDKIMGEKSE